MICSAKLTTNKPTHTPVHFKILIHVPEDFIHLSPFNLRFQLTLVTFEVHNRNKSGYRPTLRTTLKNVTEATIPTDGNKRME